MKKNIEIKGCINCPFKNYTFDDFALGDPETHTCNLLRESWSKDMVNSNISSINYIIKFTNKGKVKSKNKKTLDDCPLLEGDYVVSLKKECCGKCKCSEKDKPLPPPNRVFSEGQIPKPPKSKK